MAAPITHPSQLHLPADLDSRLLSLTETDRQRLVSDLAEALTAAQRTGDLQPVQRTMLHWYQVARIRSEPPVRGDPAMGRDPRATC